MHVTLTEGSLPVRLRTAAPMTDEELLRFCAANEPWRVEREPDGELVIMTPAGFGSSRMNSRITRLLEEWAEADGRGVTTDSNGGYALPDGSMRAPDAAWVSLEKVAQLSEAEQARFAPVSPDFVIELRSESDRRGDLEEKMKHWVANGVQVGWLIDPKERAVTIYRAGEEPERLVDPASVEGSGPVRGFCLVMGRVWG